VRSVLAAIAIMALLWMALGCAQGQIPIPLMKHGGHGGQAVVVTATVTWGGLGVAPHGNLRTPTRDGGR